MNIAETIGGARCAFEIAGRGCLVRIGEDEPRYATVTEIAARLEPHPDATMLLTAVSEAVERYDPPTEAVILLETRQRLSGTDPEPTRMGLRRRAGIRADGLELSFPKSMENSNPRKASFRGQGHNMSHVITKLELEIDSDEACRAFRAAVKRLR